MRSRNEPANQVASERGGHAHLRHIAIISLISLLVSGCVYPGWTIDNILAEDLPRPIMRAFWEGFPGARISKVERSTFGSRVQEYCIFFARPGSESLLVIYDSTGKLEGPTFGR